MSPAGKTQVMGGSGIGERTDAELIRASLADPASFAGVFDRHSASIHRYLLRRVGPAAAEDLVGETFTVAFRSRQRYELDRPDARPWLFGIATNMVHHHWRSSSRRRIHEGRGPVAESTSDPAEEAVSTVFYQSQTTPIARALAQLDPHQLDILLLVAGPGLTYDEVAVALGIPVGTVRSRLSRARLHLRELLAESGQYLDETSTVAQATATKKGSS